MIKQRTSFKGPDSINVLSIRKTDHNSILLQEAEARTYANRNDMKALIKRNIDDGLMTSFHADRIEEFSAIFSKNINYKKYKYGSTYIPIEIAISLKEEAKNNLVTCLIDDDFNIEGNPTSAYNRTFKHI